MKRLIIILMAAVMLSAQSCAPDFQRSRYKKFSLGHQWKRKKVSVFRTQTYRDPRTKTEARREMLRPKVISFDSW